MSNTIPMLQMTGEVTRVFLNPDSVDKATGVVREGQWKVQLLCDVPLKNGQERAELVTLTTDSEEFYQANKGQRVSVPVGVFAKRDTVIFYAAKGGKPVVL